MTATAIDRMFEQREQRTLAQRRQRAGARLSRERKRNAWLAFGGVASLAVLLSIGIRAAWAPSNVEEQKMDPTTREVAETRVGHVLFTSVDNVFCRQLEFHNDTGRIVEGDQYRCKVDNQPGAEASARRTADAGARKSAVNDFFHKR